MPRETVNEANDIQIGSDVMMFDSTRHEHPVPQKPVPVWRNRMKPNDCNPDAPAALPPAQGSALLPIEQPEQITGKVWFFCRGISHSGEKYGASLHVEEVKNRLTAKAGLGQLIEIDGTWFWMPNAPAQRPPT